MVERFRFPPMNEWCFCFSLVIDDGEGRVRASVLCFGRRSLLSVFEWMNGWMGFSPSLFLPNPSTGELAREIIIQRWSRRVGSKDLPSPPAPKILSHSFF